jgi:type VI protein secretion system component VasK
MTGPQMEYKISLGNILNMAALIVAVAVAWGVMSERGESTRTQMQEVRDTLKQEVDSRRQAQNSIEVRVRELESGQARADERFNSVLQVLGRIEARLERIESK